MVLGVMLDPESIPLPAKLDTTEANTPSMLVVNPQARSLLEVRRNIRRKLRRLSILLSICQDSVCFFFFFLNLQIGFPPPQLLFLSSAHPIKLLLILFPPSPPPWGMIKYNPTL